MTMPQRKNLQGDLLLSYNNIMIFPARQRRESFMPRKPSKPKTTRRGKNEGSVYRRKDGKWVGQVTVGYHPDTGKPIRKYT